LPLRDDRPLWHDEGACLPLRSRHGQCRACATVCPVQALEVGVDAVTLGAACVGCGRCTAVCPTGALGLPELDALRIPIVAMAQSASARRRDFLQSTQTETARHVRFECRMVPAPALEADSVVLPCLGALTPGRIAAHVAAGQQVTVVDRGWCEGCAACESPRALNAPNALVASAAAQGIAAADEAVRQALSWLGALDSASPPDQAAATSTASTVAAGTAVGDALQRPLRERVSLVRELLPLALRPAFLPAAPALEPAVDRRSFFRAALERPAGRDRAATPMGGDGRAAYPARDRQPAPERTRLHAALAQLAQARATQVPAEFFPTLHADARCCDSRMCVALCPTAALTVADDGATAHLRFDPLRCIACGTCTRACPEGALVLTPHGGGTEDPLHAGEIRSLASHRRHLCADCGDTFTAHGDATALGAPGTASEAGAGTDTGIDAGTDGMPPPPALCPTCRKSRRFIADARRQLFGALN
jgi:Fe-S-cluster-containing hydrogenase component 2